MSNYFTARPLSDFWSEETKHALGDLGLNPPAAVKPGRCPTIDEVEGILSQATGCFVRKTPSGELDVTLHSGVYELLSGNSDYFAGVYVSGGHSSDQSGDDESNEAVFVENVLPEMVVWIVELLASQSSCQQFFVSGDDGTFLIVEQGTAYDAKWAEP